MGVNQPLYDYETWTTNTHRGVECYLCGWQTKLPRFGGSRAINRRMPAGQRWRGNALATAAKLRSKLREHIREKHPEEYARLLDPPWVASEES